MRSKPGPKNLTRTVNSSCLTVTVWMPNPSQMSLSSTPWFRASTSLDSPGDTIQNCAASVCILVCGSEITVIIQRINISLLKSSLIKSILSSQALPFVCGWFSLLLQASCPQWLILLEINIKEPSSCYATTLQF